MDNILAASNDWQWFIKEIEKNYDLSEASDWNSYLKRRGNYEQIYAYYIRILKIDNFDFSFDNAISEELFICAKYYLGLMGFEEASKKASTVSGKIALLIVWLTKLGNAYNEIDSIADTRCLFNYNLFKLLNFTGMQEDEEIIVSYIDSIHIEGFEQAKSCLLDNIHMVEHTANSAFIDNNKEAIWNANAFNFKQVETSQYGPWEEKYLLDMVKIRIRDHKIIPCMEFGNYSYPDIMLWDEYTIKLMKSYFKNEVANFVLESIDYVNNGNMMTKEVASDHFTLLTNAINDDSTINFLGYSSLEIISYLFNDKAITSLNMDDKIALLEQSLEKVTDEVTLITLKERGIPLPKTKKDIVRNYYNSQYRRIDHVTDKNEFVDYLQNVYVTRTINNDYFSKIISKVNEYISGDIDLETASLFYWYMIFLIRLKGNKDINKEMVQREMIHKQQIWHDRYYEQSKSILKEAKQEFTIPKKTLDNCNLDVLHDAIILGRECVFPDLHSILTVMEDTSKNVFLNFAQCVELNSEYPKLEPQNFPYERHEVDGLLKKQIEEIKSKYGYKLLNEFDTDSYVKAVHKRYKEITKIRVALFDKTKELYDKVKQNTEFELIPFEDEITIAHITQLFPLLEMKIREFASIVNIVPFKESEKDFMKYKDPSSIIREILTDVYEHEKSFESVPDFLFIYNMMYNSNSLNIRNECIHGRDYIYSDKENAFKITLLSISMVMKRTEIVKENFSVGAED